MQLKGNLPSPAMLVSVIALVLALAGSAVALPGKGSVDKNDIAKGAVRAKAIKDGAVKTTKIKDKAVTEAKLADKAVTTGKIADGVLPTYAYAYVDNSPAIIASQSKNMGSATVALENSFVCFYDLPFAPKNVQVTTVRPGGGIEDSLPQVWVLGEDNNFCSGAESASVQFYDVSSDVADGSPPRFFISLQG